jgi:hypothetical protein
MLYCIDMCFNYSFMFYKLAYSSAFLAVFTRAGGHSMLHFMDGHLISMYLIIFKPMPILHHGTRR